jgi:hypothetical protein
MNEREIQRKSHSSRKWKIFFRYFHLRFSDVNLKLFIRFNGVHSSGNILSRYLKDDEHWGQTEVTVNDGNAVVDVEGAVFVTIDRHEIAREWDHILGISQHCQTTRSLCGNTFFSMPAKESKVRQYCSPFSEKCLTSFRGFTLACLLRSTSLRDPQEDYKSRNKCYGRISVGTGNIIKEQLQMLLKDSMWIQYPQLAFSLFLPNPQIEFVTQLDLYQRKWLVFWSWESLNTCSHSRFRKFVALNNHLTRELGPLKLRWRGIKELVTLFKSWGKVTKNIVFFSSLPLSAKVTSVIRF